jgi:uncharacterized membrane protein YccF (DUF307 family)
VFLQGVNNNMSIFGNIIWLIFGGFLAGLGYILGGLALCITIVGIPFGVQAIQLGVATLAPFGKEIKNSERAGGLLSLIFDVIWLLVVGWEIAVAHLIGGILLSITVVGLPFGMQHFKLIPVALFPFNYELE